MPTTGGRGWGIRLVNSADRGHPLHTKPLFGAEGDHRVDAVGAAGGNVTGEKSHGGEKQRDGEESCEVAGVDAEEQGAHQASEGECGGIICAACELPM
jgi:hypothetical protein